ncbi:MAG: AAA family ATPase, partial [Anaerolineae bacterium]
LVAAADCAEILSAALTVDIPAERILPFRTARELAQETPPEVDWLARPWVATGAITEVDGMVKLAGKTTWVMHLVRAVLDGKPFLAEPTRKTAVVYLSEQTGPSLRQALARAGLLDRDDLVLLRWHDTIAVPWPEVVSAAVAEASRRGAALLVVDVLSQFAGLSGDAENNAGAAQEALAPLQQAAGRGLAVVIVRHERKGGGEVGEAARGSSAFGGGVDIIISIRRHQGETRPAIRVLHTLSRFDETPNELVIELTPAGYVVVGSEAAFAVAEAKEAILDVIPASEMAAVTLDELADKTAVKRTSLQQAVHEMLRAGELKRLGQGKRGDPYRFYRAISFAAASVREQEFLSAGIPTI